MGRTQERDFCIQDLRMTVHRTERNFGVLLRASFYATVSTVCPDAYIFCESSKRMDDNEKNAEVGILVFDVVMGNIMPVGRRQNDQAEYLSNCFAGNIDQEMSTVRKNLVRRLP